MQVLPETATVSTKDWMLFLGPLLGVVVGGLITSVVKVIELRFNRKQSKRDAQIKRLEEISIQLIQVSKDVNYFGAYLRLLLNAGNAEASYQLLDQATHPVLKLTNAIYAFFPTKRAEATEILNLHGELITLENNRVIRASNDPNDPEIAVMKSQFTEKANILHTKTVALRRIINDEIGRLLT